MTKKITRTIYVAIVMMFDNLFLYGMLMKRNRARRTEVNMIMGIANIGSKEKAPIRRQTPIFLRYRMRMRQIPNLFDFSIPL